MRLTSSILVDAAGSRPLDRGSASLKQMTRSSIENPSVPLTDPDAWHDVFGGGPSDAGVVVNRQTALTYATFWRGLNLISGAVAKLPFYVKKYRHDGGWEKYKKHPSYRLLLRKPNQFMIALVLRRTMQYHALIRGNGYAYINRLGSGAPDPDNGLLLLDPEETYPVVANRRLWYVTSVGTAQRKLPPEDVFHLKGMGFDGLCGHDVLQIGRQSLGMGLAARKFVRGSSVAAPRRRAC